MAAEPPLPAPPHTHGTVRMMICGREHRVSIFLLLFCIVCWVVVVGSVGLMHVAVMFVCWFVSTVLLDFLVVVFFLLFALILTSQASNPEA